jgi:hypothetical protein
MWAHRYLTAALIVSAILPGFCAPVAAQSGAPAELISGYRLEHGEGKVRIDPTLNRIAHEQAAAMAEKDLLDHGVLASFNSRVAPAGRVRAAENIAYGFDNFLKTLDQWIGSSGHRSNLLLHGASRVGVASAKSKSGRTYWAMVIAEEKEKERPKRPKGEPKTAANAEARTCQIQLLSLCLKE